MEKWVQIFKCIISHSSTKSLVPPLHKFTMWKLDLFFSLFWETKFTYQHCVLTDLSIFREDGKKLVPLKSRITFCRLFIVRVKKVSYEKKVWGELLGCFFIVHWSVSAHMFLIQALGWCCYGTRQDCQCYNERNIPTC